MSERLRKCKNNGTENYNATERDNRGELTLIQTKQNDAISIIRQISDTITREPGNVFHDHRKGI